jgi:hypothetical protein
MKKLIAIVLSVLMVLSFAACGQTSDETTAPETNAPETNAPETNAPETQAPAVNDNVILPTVTEGSWGAAFWADFEVAVAANKGATADVIANAVQMSASGAAMGMAMAMPMEEGFFQGFSADVTGFKSAAAIAPMMSSALMVYVFELDAGANVREFVKHLNDNADPAWMICMTAETTTIGAIDNYVLVAYAPTNMPGGAAEAVIIEPTVEAGSKQESLWNEFLSYMDINGSFALSTDVVDTLAMNEAFGENMPTAEVLGEVIEIAGFKYAIDGHNNAAMIKANGIAVYVIQVDAGMDSWADYYIAGNLSEGAVWGGHGYTYIVMVNAEA